MNRSLAHLYNRFRREGGERASTAIISARIVARFEELETLGLVRLRAEDEQENYWSVYGKPEDAKHRKSVEAEIERNGCAVCIAEYLNGEARDGSDNWEHADSIGMCVYRRPLSPFENCHVPDLMRSAIEQADRLLARAELTATLAD